MKPRITKEELEEILVSYGVSYTSALADRLLKIIEDEINGKDAEE